MSGSYEATFRWPHPGASDVIVTGTFDGWTCSHHLTRRPSGTFEGTVQIPWGETVQYKYIVDGRWTTTDDQPTELDPIGNLNNVLRAPARPPTPVAAFALDKVKEEKPEEEEEEEKEKEAQEPAQRGVLGTVVDTVNGHVDFVKQAAVSMVEAIAPGTTETPAATPVAETSKLEPAPQEQPVPAPEPSEPEPPAASTDLTSAVLPVSPAPESTLPEVPVPVLPLSTEPPVETATLPSADVSESKPLETTIVEGSATQETAVEPAPAPAPALAPEPEPVKEVEVVPVTAGDDHAAANGDVKESAVEAQDVAASKPLETTVVDGSATAETAIAPVETAPAQDAENKPSTHAPAEASEKADEKPAANGTEPAPASAVNGTNGAHAPEPGANGKAPSSSPAKAPTPPGSNGTSPSSTPAKEKRMRFPSLSSRSLHARSRSSAESALAPSELGEGGSKTASANGSVASRKSAAAGAGATERAKRRTSMFGKLKDIFHHKHEASA